MSHLHKTVTEGCKRAIVLCSDTYVLALLCIIYMNLFPIGFLSYRWSLQPATHPDSVLLIGIYI